MRKFRSNYNAEPCHDMGYIVARNSQHKGRSKADDLIAPFITSFRPSWPSSGYCYKNETNKTEN